MEKIVWCFKYTFFLGKTYAQRRKSKFWLYAKPNTIQRIKCGIVYNVWLTIRNWYYTLPVVKEHSYIRSVTLIFLEKTAQPSIYLQNQTSSVSIINIYRNCLLFVFVVRMRGFSCYNGTWSEFYGSVWRCCVVLKVLMCLLTSRTSQEKLLRCFASLTHIFPLLILLWW